MMRAVSWKGFVMGAYSALLIAFFYVGGVFASGGGSWRVEGEYLYLLPSVGDTFFVIDGPQSQAFPNGKQENNGLGFHSGYRVGLGYTLCAAARSFDVEYTHLDARSRRTVSGVFLAASTGHPDFVSQFSNYAGTAFSDLDLTYHRVDGLMSQTLWNCCCLDVSFLVGVEYAYIRLKEEYEYRSAAAVGNIDDHTKTWGVGPQFGMGFGYEVYTLACGFCPGTVSINGGVLGGLLVSASKASTFNILSTNGVIVDVMNEKDWYVVPALHARMGLGYTTSFTCFTLALEVGYEFNTYIHGLSRSIYTDEASESLNFINYTDFDLHGLYVSCAVSF